MRDWLVDLILAPRAAFAAVPDHPSLVGPATIVLALGATSVVELGVVVDVVGPLAQVFGGPLVSLAVGRASAAAPGSLLAAAALSLLVPVVGWLLTTGVIYAVAHVFDPAPAPRRLLALLGWGHVPLLVPTVASTAQTVVALARAPPLATRGAAEAWLRTAIVASPARAAIELAGPLFALWAVVLWVLATAEALGLSRRQAVACVALPTALTLLDAVGGAVTVLVR